MSAPVVHAHSSAHVGGAGDDNFSRNVRIVRNGEEMGTRKSEKAKIDSDWFRWVLSQCGASIRSLGDPDTGIGWNERTLRRALSDGAISPDLLEAVAKRLNVHPDYLSGKDAWTCECLPEDDARKVFLERYMRPEQHPYIDVEQERMGVDGYIKATLLMHGVDWSSYLQLSRGSREYLFSTLDEAVTSVLKRWFPDCEPARMVALREAYVFLTPQDVGEAMHDYYIERGRAESSD